MDKRVDIHVNNLVNILKLAFFGTPTVERNGTAIHFRTRKTLALLAYLAVENEPKTRAHLAQFLWAESENANARQMLRTTLAHLKNAFAETDEILLADGDTLRLNPDAKITLDTWALDAAATLRANRETENRIDRLSPIISLYRGEFLENLTLNDAPAFDDWVRLRREHYHQQYSRVLKHLTSLQTAQGQMQAALETAQGQMQAALETAQRWHVHDPLDEAAARQLMQIHLSREDRAAALRVFEQFRRTLRSELAADPSPETLALAQEIARTSAPAAHPRFATAPSPQQFIASIPLIGRAGEFARVANAWFRATSGEVQVLAVQGEAGIGKTRLATEFARYVAGEGADVLSGRAFETGGQLPYQPLIDALRPRLERENAPDDLVSDLWLAELARLLPELRERYPDLPNSPTDAPARLYEAFARLVIALADRAPVLLYLDDAQWADTASLDALQYSLPRWMQTRARVLLLLTLRSEALGSFTPWFAEAAHSATVTPVSLAALSSENTLQLVQSLAHKDAPALREISRWLYDETNGQPFFLMETLKALLERGDLVATRARDTWVIDFSTAPVRPLDLSADMQQVVLARVKRLSPIAADLMLTASVLGSASEFEILRDVSGIAENDALRALDDLLAGGLLRETNGKIAAGHDKIRDVVYASIGETRRRVLHRRAFEHLTAHHGSPAARAHHALAAGLQGHAFHALVEAGDEALRVFAPRDAIAFYEHARALAGQTLVNPDLYLQLGRAYELTDAPLRAREIYRELLAQAQATAQPDVEARALNRLAILALQELDATAGLEIARRALDRATAARDALLIAETNWTLAQIHMYVGDSATGLVYGETALENARTLNQPELIARSLNVLAYIYGGVGRAAQAVEVGAESSARFRALGNRAMEIDSLVQVSSAQRRLGKSADAATTAQTARALARATENEWGILDATLQGALALLEHGEYGAALSGAQAGLDAARTHHMPILIMIGHLALGIIYRELLDFDRAAQILIETLDAPLVPALVATVHSELAAVYAMAGDWEKAFPYAHNASLSGVHPLMLIRSGLPLETNALLRGGAVDEAHAGVEKFRALVHSNPRYEIVLLRAEAVLAQHHGTSAQTTAYLERAAQLAEQLNVPGELWKIYAALGNRAAALQIITSLSATIDDRAVRDHFVATATRLIES